MIIDFETRKRLDAPEKPWLEIGGWNDPACRQAILAGEYELVEIVGHMPLKLAQHLIATLEKEIAP